MNPHCQCVTLRQGIGLSLVQFRLILRMCEQTVKRLRTLLFITGLYMNADVIDRRYLTNQYFKRRTYNQLTNH